MGEKLEIRPYLGVSSPACGYDVRTISDYVAPPRTSLAPLLSLAGQSSPLLRLLSVLEQQLSRHCKGRPQSPTLSMLPPGTFLSRSSEFRREPASRQSKQAVTDQAQRVLRAVRVSVMTDLSQ